jgi:polyphenol oxidase
MIPSQSKSLASLSPVAHGFFGRQGGVSDGQFASLNCGYGSGDDVSRVRQNRDSVARQVGTVEANLLTAYQIHSAEAVHVKAAWTREEAPKADAMATTERGIALGILTADCAPVLLCDGAAGVIGAAHAGWKGALDGVLDAVVALMERLGADRSRIRAAIGPCIEQNSYEVGPEFFQRFIEAAPGNSKFFIGASRDGHKLFDLPGFVESRLKTLDVRDVERLSLCTYVNEADYYSFRRSTHRGEPGYGRNMSAIMLKAS